MTEIKKVDTEAKMEVAVVNEVEKNEVVDKKVDKKTNKNTLPDSLTKEFKFTKALDAFKNKLNEQTDTIKHLRAEIKKLETSYNTDIMKAFKTKTKYIKKNASVPTGFVKPTVLPDGMAKIIHVETGTVMSMPDYTRKFYEELKTRKLLHDKDKRIFRADDEIMTVFKLPASVNESVNYRDKNGFNFSTLQGIISKLLKEMPVQVAEPVVKVAEPEVQIVEPVVQVKVNKKSGTQTNKKEQHSSV